MDRRPPIQIVDSTLREGEQFAGADFSSADRLDIARALDDFGVDYIEVTSPAASPASARDAARIRGLVRRAKVLAHVRCHEADVRAALDCGVHGVNLLFGTSQWLQEHGHGRRIDQILARAAEVIGGLRGKGVEVRFSCEDAFRTHPDDLLRVLCAVDQLGVDRVGIADTVGIATPFEVLRVVGAVRAAVRCDIEFHGHNDAGCAVANAHAAWMAGATHIDTTVLGIGERNGITALSGLIARLYLIDPELVTQYDLSRLASLDQLVAERAGVQVPFNSCITSATAFTHKAGMHTHAVLNDPRTYEAIDPSVFGRAREVLVGHRLTGHHAVAHRARELGLSLDEGTLRAAARDIKRLSDEGPLGAEGVDAVLHRMAKECAERSMAT